ncbi:hypothetical protein [Frankia sp. R82]|uniref:hypothetical protein n=1 Tax=Frankia sp. R82 TaxID=2950553 RepID=UPI002042F275|nr:hypothetical protein [Frankia sp. R82]MCM3882718.1 hypothetical protein [Frankia sp. R82]
MDLPVGSPPINFHAHRLRSNDAGGRHDFEQMVTSLVDQLQGPAHNIEPAPGDWGIDVYTGDLTDQGRIWQVKYFIDGVKDDQLASIRKSFARAWTAASEQRYRIEEWTLCIPVTMDGPRTQRFERWRAEQTQLTGVPIVLWDETRLRTLLSQPECSGLREIYYGSSSTRAHEAASGSALRIRADETVLDAASPDATPWHGGLELRVGGVVHLLHEPVTQWTAPDRSWVLRDVTARELEPGDRLVRLRHLWVRHRTPDATSWYDALRTQAQLLTALRGTAGLPELIAPRHRGDHAVLVMSAPVGRTWREVHGEAAAASAVLASPTGPDRIVAARVLADAAALCETLAVLHRAGQAHRRLTPDDIVFPAAEGAHARRGGRDQPRSRGPRQRPSGGRTTPMLRDLGLVGMSARLAPDGTAGAGGMGGAGGMEERGETDAAATDVRQVAALVRGVLGSRPSRIGGPEQLDEVLSRAAAADPRHWPRLDELADALRAARRPLSLGEHDPAAETGHS